MSASLRGRGGEKTRRTFQTTPEETFHMENSQDRIIRKIKNAFEHTLIVYIDLACENSRFSSLLAARDI